VNFAAITLCVASQRVFVVVVIYFVTTQSGNFWIHSRIIGSSVSTAYILTELESNSYSYFIINYLLYPQSSAEFKSEWSFTAISSYIIVAWCLIKHRNNFAFIKCSCPRITYISYTRIKVEVSKGKVVPVLN
jgi:hypothetical protein